MPQIKIDKQPVKHVTINEVDPENQAEALALMAGRARFMHHQPRFISISLASQPRWASRCKLHSAGKRRLTAPRAPVAGISQSMEPV